MFDVNDIETKRLTPTKSFFVLTIDDVIHSGDLIRNLFLDGYVSNLEDAKYYYNWKSVEVDIPAWIGRTQRDLIKMTMGADYNLICTNDVVADKLVPYEIIRYL